VDTFRFKELAGKKITDCCYLENLSRLNCALAEHTMGNHAKSTGKITILITHRTTKMEKRYLNASFLIPLAALLMLGCSRMPQKQIDETNAAIEEIKTAGADLYLPEEYAALQDSMRSVMETVEAEKSKLIKNFRSAEEQLAGVVRYAREVKTRTEARKEDLKNEIRTTLSEVVTLIESNRQLILQAPRGKEGTSVMLAIGNELNTIQETVTEAQSMMERGEYLTTLSRAKAARENAASINKELQEVIAKYKANVRR
jgi:hypothetical protein